MTVVPPAPFRVARGSVVASVGVALAAAAHGAAGGAVLADLPLAIPAAAALAGCVVAAQRAWTVGRLVTALVAVQLVVHGSLWLTAGDQPVDPRLAGLTSPASLHVHAHAAATTTPAMLAAHAVAVLAAALLLAGVDAAVLTVWALGRAVLGVRALAAVLPDGPTAPSPASVPLRARERGLLVSPRRGPPVATAPC